MKEEKMKVLSRILILLLVVGMLSACGGASDGVGEGDGNNLDQGATSEQGNKNFGTIEDISDLVDDAVELMSDVTEDVDDLTVSMQSMNASFIHSTIVMSAMMEYVMNGSQEQYQYDRTEMPSGQGEYEGSLEKDGDFYTWKYNSYYNDGLESYSQLVYDTVEGFVEINNDGNDQETNKNHIQIKRVEGDSVLASYCNLKTGDRKATQIVLMGKPGQVYYATRTIDASTVELPISIEDMTSTDWEALKGDIDYDIFITYDGSELSYTGL
jgi:hypothetical protein